MTLQEFLKAVGGKESDIISYSGQKAMAAVKQNGYSLQYVKEQTPEICMAAVKQNGDSLQYVKEQIFSKVRTLEFDGKSISISEESYQSLRVFFSNINKEV